MLLLSSGRLVHAAPRRGHYPADGAKKKATPSSERAHSTTAAEEVEGKVVATAQDFYNNPNALNFHKQIWGGDVHIGFYNLLEGEDAKLEGVERIKKAGLIATRAILTKAFPPTGPSSNGSTVMDMGSAYGGTARIAAKEFGCNVVCIDVSQGENAVNAELSAAAGLADKITIPGERSFFDTGVAGESVDVVVSQDSLLHAGSEFHKAIKEAACVLKPGGIMSVADPMQSEAADPHALTELFRLVKVDRIADVTAYERWGKEYGLELVEFDDKTANVSTHYHNLVELVATRRPIKGCDDPFLDWMSARYNCWLKAASQDLVRYGILVLKKKH